MAQTQCNSNGFFLTLRILTGIAYIWLAISVYMDYYYQMEFDGTGTTDGISLIVNLGLYLLAFNAYLFFRRTDLLKIKHLYLIIYSLIVPSLLFLIEIPLIEQNEFLREEILARILVILNSLNLLIYFMSIFEPMFIRKKNKGE